MCVESAHAWERASFEHLCVFMGIFGQLMRIKASMVDDSLAYSPHSAEVMGSISGPGLPVWGLHALPMSLLRIKQFMGRWMSIKFTNSVNTAKLGSVSTALVL